MFEPEDILRYRSLAIVGLAKNTGKTECLNYILRKAGDRASRFALTSIGVDGEKTDRVCQTEKPEITVPEGMVFVTSEKHYREKRLVAEVLDISDEQTALGRLVTARAVTEGKVLLSGPAHTGGLRRLIAQMHKAITVIQLKLEAETIRRRPEFEMENRLLLHRIDFNRKVFALDGKDYEMRDCRFPTVNPDDPYRLTDEERDIVSKLHHSFISSEKLKKHMKCLFRYGCMYNVCNSNLLFHASMPLNADGTLKEVEILGEKFKGRNLLDRVGQLIRTAYFAENDNPEKAFAVDFVWYLWCGKNSPAFDKSKMATFERYFLTDKETHREAKGHYYELRDREDICDMIMDEFGVEGEHRHIINGHVPVKAVKGEKPIKANGKLMVIDGGFSKAYQPETGIAGYTLVYHSRGFELVQHEPFTSTQKAIEEGIDIKSTTQIVELSSKRMMVKDTDKGRELMVQIEDLKKLLLAYQSGLMKERAV